MKKTVALMLLAFGFGAKGQAVFTAEYTSQADVNVFVVDYESQAGWRTAAKKHLMY